MISTELHCHTTFSSDSLLTIEELFETSVQKSIQKIAITDHNTIKGAMNAKEKYPELVIIGEEVMTSDGELLAYFIEECIPAGLDPFHTIELIREQNGFISVSHPFDITRPGHWNLYKLIEITPYIDAIETFNARCLWPGWNDKARQFANKYGLLGTVGSDAHSLKEIGSALIRLEYFWDSESFKNSLAKGDPQMRLSAPWVHLSSTIAKFNKNQNKS